MDGEARRRNPSHYGLGTRRRNYRTGDLVSSALDSVPVEANKAADARVALAHAAKAVSSP